MAERTDEKKAYELLNGNVISAGASISAAKKSRSNGDQRNQRHVSLNITKHDVDIREDLSDNVVMHCHDPRNRRTRDEGVDFVSTTDDVLRWCLHQRIPSSRPWLLTSSTEA